MPSLSVGDVVRIRACTCEACRLGRSDSSLQGLLAIVKDRVGDRVFIGEPMDSKHSLWFDMDNLDVEVLYHANR